MSEVIEHLSNEILYATVKELHRVLKKGGKLFITVPAFEILEENTFYCPTCDCHMHKWGHERSFHSKSELIEPFIDNFNVLLIKNKFFGGWGN